MSYSTIKFIAQGPHSLHPGAVEFSLGLGPCGLHVYSLEMEAAGQWVVITQSSYPEDYRQAQKAFGEKRDQLVMEARSADEHGWNSVMAATRPKEQWLADQMQVDLEGRRLWSLGQLVEIKQFHYKVDDIRGRITAVKL